MLSHTLGTLFSSSSSHKGLDKNQQYWQLPKNPPCSQRHITKLTRRIGIGDEQEQLTDTDITPILGDICNHQARMNSWFGTLEVKLIGMLVIEDEWWGGRNEKRRKHREKREKSMLRRHDNWVGQFMGYKWEAGKRKKRFLRSRHRKFKHCSSYASPTIS